MRNPSQSIADVKIEDIKHHFNDTLIEKFYLFGIEPNSLNISEFTIENNVKKYLKVDFKEVQLLTKFPSDDKYQSDIDPTILMCHCFPSGYHLVENDKQPDDEYFYFNINNLCSVSNFDKKLYFVCAIIYEPLKLYFDIKFQHKTPEFNEKGEKAVDFKKIFVPKALCFSSFVSFPHEIKLLLNELIRYIRSNKITLPIELIMENIIYGMPRPLRAYFYVSCNKSNSLIPGQTKDIDFNLPEINQYNIISYPYQSIVSVFSSANILGIFRCILLEFPILFFCKDKEKLTKVVETFLSLIYPFEYQYPHISILPDCNAGLIEIEKSFIFGINRKLVIKTVELKNNDENTKKNTKINVISYFSEMNLNISNKSFLICDIDEGKASGYCFEKDMYHVIGFDDLGVYPDDNNIVDPTLNVSKDLYTGKLADITQDTTLPDKYTDKLKNKIEAFKKENKKIDFVYSANNNKRLGTDVFYYYLASVFMNYNNYLYNTKEEIEKICIELLTKTSDEINVENLFNINQFLQDYRNDTVFFTKFFKTKLFKNFIIKKYLNEPFEKYIYLNFDEKILEKKNKRLFSRKVKTEFATSTMFQSTHPYNMRLPNKRNFSEEELNYMKTNKNVLLNEYYQNIGNDNKISYVIFPKITYDNKFFKKQYHNNEGFAKNESVIKLLKNYHQIEEYLNSEKSKNFFNIYNGEFVNRYNIDITKFQFNNELFNALKQIWLIAFCLTFHYFDEREKFYRFEELIQFLSGVIDPDEKILSILLLAIKKYGNQEMTIKLFELIKNLNYAHYTCLISKFKSNKKLNWDKKEIDIANNKVIIKYFREPIVYDKQTNDKEKSENNVDINFLRKRTFYTGKESIIKPCEKENIFFELYFNCPSCKNQEAITEIINNLNSKKKGTLMICSKCKKKMEPVYHAIYAQEKIEFKIQSVLDLLKMGKNVLKKYGTQIDIDVLRTEYKDFFWNCILYFNFNTLNFEILLKYKSSIPQLRRTFKVLQISKQ